MSTVGYKKDRFPNLQGQIFDCLICQNIVKSPKQCSGCGNLYCSQCIDGYISKNNLCPNKCAGSSITNMTARALINIYNDLDIKCLKCPKTLKLGDLLKHQQLCGKPKCQFFQYCSGYENTKQQYKPFCSKKCKLLSQILQSKGDNKKVYQLLFKYIPIKQSSNSNSNSNSNPNSNSNSNNPSISSSSVQSNDKIILKWSGRQCGMNIQITNDNTSVFLKQQAYVFRTVLATMPFMGGKHYWQIHADSRTQNQLKIGVSASNVFQFNTAFCDHKFGYAYYGLGQLRHGSNATGQQYGKRFKKTGILGVYLNMDRGTLSFSLNGEDFGIAYDDPELKKGPLYPAVALLHCSGCVIKGELPIPKIYELK